MSKDITELQTHLFDTLRGLKDGSLKPEVAQAINDTAQTIINSAKVEVDHMKVAGGYSRFIAGENIPTLTLTGSKTVTTLPGIGILTQHKLGG